MSDTCIEEAFTIDRSTIETINLSGFPNVRLIDYIKKELENVTDYEPKNRPRGFMPIFDPSSLKSRQKVIKNIYKNQDANFLLRQIKEIKKLNNGFPDNRRMKDKDLVTLCEKADELDGICKSFFRKYIEISDDPTFKSLKKEANKKHREFKELFKNLEKISNIDSYYINLGWDNSTIIPIYDQKIPSKPKIKVGNVHDVYEYTEKMNKDMKKAAVKFHKAVDKTFKNKIYWHLENSINVKKKDSLVRKLEDLAVPYIIAGAHEAYTQSFVTNNIKRLAELNVTYPKFSNRFEIQNLFPINLRSEYDPYARDFDALPKDVPINLKTTKDESKFLFVGLNSGGKSFTLENIVSNMILGNMGLPLIADKVVFPKYKTLTYYNNTKRKTKGKLETEMDEVSKMAKRSKKGDIIIIDNFFEGGIAEVINYSADKFLDLFSNSKSQVFIETHAPVDLDYFEDKGWVIFSPEFEEKKGKIMPTYKISRQRPNYEVVKRYAKERADHYINKKCKASDEY